MYTFAETGTPIIITITRRGGGKAASGTVRTRRNDASIGGEHPILLHVGATFAAFISFGSYKVAIRLGLCTYSTSGILSVVVFRECRGLCL